jgi:hypothetical protein
MPFFGSPEKKRDTDAGGAIINDDYCVKCIITFGERNDTHYCDKHIGKVGGLSI